VLDNAVIRHFRQIGGELVTLGSDAHDYQRVGEGLEEAARLLISEGYRYTAYFAERKAVLVPLAI
jgi:histidinol-phosphatase (PHP family)